jgi:hypothetical protein
MLNKITGTLLNSLIKVKKNNKLQRKILVLAQTYFVIFFKHGPGLLKVKFFSLKKKFNKHSDSIAGNTKTGLTLG